MEIKFQMSRWSSEKELLTLSDQHFDSKTNRLEEMCRPVFVLRDGRLLSAVPADTAVFHPQEATMGIWSNYFVAHSAAAFEAVSITAPSTSPRPCRPSFII